MRRQYLEDLGLEKAVIDQVMAENGKDQNKLKEEIETLKAQLAAFDGVDIEAMQKELETLKQTAEAEKESAEAYRREVRLEKALAKTNCHDVDTLKREIAQDRLRYTEDGIEGLSEQVDALRKDKAFLFKTEDATSFIPKTSTAPASGIAEEVHQIFFGGNQS